ncbi:prominin-1-A [Macrobrachium rosenbergii]|uniref:prominin-1-A n=1 Tax=Macrobrachium rosenbergii TaxID=79674 RepID=UPI0034D69307
MFLSVTSLWRFWIVILLVVTSLCSFGRAFSEWQPDVVPPAGDCHQTHSCPDSDEGGTGSPTTTESSQSILQVDFPNGIGHGTPLPADREVRYPAHEFFQRDALTENYGDGGEGNFPTSTAVPRETLQRPNLDETSTSTENRTNSYAAVLSIGRTGDAGSVAQRKKYSWSARSLPPTEGPRAHRLRRDEFSEMTTHLPRIGTMEPKINRKPFPVVTVTSRILSPGRNRNEGKKLESEKSPLSRDPQIRNIEFEPVPEGDRYGTDTTLAQPTILAWAGAFVSLLQPSHFPYDLVMEALERRITAEELITESLQAEPGFIACIGVGLTLAVGVPILGLMICCCRLCGRCGGKRKQHNRTTCFNCQRRTLTVSLASISMAVSLGIIVVLVSNERLGWAVNEARVSVKDNVRDLDTFLRNTKMQLRYLVSNSLEQTVDAIHEDLDDIEFLLGRPLQRELAAEAQIEVALDSLLHISSSLRDIAGRMRALEESRLQAAARAEELRGRLYDLSQDIKRFVERCTPEDAELCKSLDHQGLELEARFDSFSFSEQLRHLSAVENHNLTETARHARLEFENIPAYVEVVTRQTREDVKRVVRNFRARVYNKVRGLDDVAFDLEVRTRDMTWRVDEAAANLQEHEIYRWYIGLVIALSLAFVWTLMTIGLICGCCSHSASQAPTERSCISNSAGQTLISSVFFMFLFSAILWTAVVALFVVGAHAHAFICHPLYEEPYFPTLTHLIDESGMVSHGPLLSNVLHKNRNVPLSIGHVLNQCKEGEAAYHVFKLNHYFDIEAEINPHTTLDLREPLGRLNVNLSHVELLSPEAEAHLDSFLRSIRIDMEPYRRQMEKPLVRKSLPALTEQMQNIAGQLRSVSSSAELFRMVARTRNLVSNTLYPLEKRKEDVTYQVATLDMEVMPLQRQINQSSGHLRTIQYFIHNHGSSLAASKARAYVERILSYPRQYADHVRNSALHHVAPCTPVWNLYDSARGVSCNGIIEPLNALWLATGWCLLLFLPAICMSLSLARFYLRMDYDDDTLPLQSNGSPSGSQTNVHTTESSVMWASKDNGNRPSRSYQTRHQNGPPEEERTEQLYAPPRRRSRSKSQTRSRRQSGSTQPSREICDLIAGVQVATWRDAWKAGANFVTMELVSRHVHRSIDWVHHHWNDDPRALAEKLAVAGRENTYQEPGPPTDTTEKSECGNCCDGT